MLQIDRFTIHQKHKNILDDVGPKAVVLTMGGQQGRIILSPVTSIYWYRDG